jgi:hypothetical protein
MLAANHAANANLEHPLQSETLKDMQWTLPGTDTLTPQALALANTYIDQTKFPDGVSPLTKLYPESTPDAMDGPWTEQELERLAAMNLNRTVAPPPIIQQNQPETESMPVPDSPMQGAVPDDDDVFLQPPRPSLPTPLVALPPIAPPPLTPPPLAPMPLAPLLVATPLSQDEDQVMVDVVEAPHPSLPPPVVETPSNDSPRRSMDEDQVMADAQLVGQTLQEDQVMADDTCQAAQGNLEHAGNVDNADATQDGSGAPQDPPPVNRPPQPSTSVTLPKSKPPRSTRKIVMSSGDEAEGEGDEAEGDSELSSPPSSPVPKTRKAAKAPKPASHPQSDNVQDPVALLHRALGPNFGSKPTLHGSLSSQVSGPTNMVTTPAPPVRKSIFSLMQSDVNAFSCPDGAGALLFSIFQPGHNFTTSNI